MTLNNVSVTGTYREFKKLFDNYNIRHFVRVDVDRYLVDIRVNDGFKIGKITSVKGLIKKLKMERMC